jgi:4-deoxy-L-threo-5-hexosulose-uronate ketol-isomerase
MDIRYSANPNDMKRYTTEELRREFHISGLFVDDTVQAVYSHVDRMVVFGCKPVTKAVPLDEGIDVWHNFGTKFILERREIGIFNVGGAGTITCDGTEYRLGHKDCLYVTMGTREVVFRSDDASHPALFYMVSAPAHKPCKTTLLTIAQAKKVPCGSPETSNDRVINQFIHPDVLETCQLSMGLTSLKPGSVWNTMPAHTHERRMEVYFYFDIPEDNVVFHFMGQPQETRHLVMQNYDAVISPSWSIHAGCGHGKLYLHLGHGRRKQDLHRHGRH